MQNIPRLAAVVTVFSFFLLLRLITGVTVTSMLVNVTLMLSVIWMTRSTYFLKYQNKTQYIDVMLT